MRFSRVLVVVTVAVLAVFATMESLVGAGGLTAEEAFKIGRNSPLIQKWLKNYDHYSLEVYHGNASGLLHLIYNSGIESPWIQFHSLNASAARTLRSYGVWDMSWGFYNFREPGTYFVNQIIDGENGEVLSESLGIMLR